LAVLLEKLAQPIRSASGRRQDVVITLATRLRPYQVADAERDGGPQFHDWDFLRRALTAALAALKATAPPAAGAPALALEFLDTSEASRLDVRVTVTPAGRGVGGEFDAVDNHCDRPRSRADNVFKIWPPTNAQIADSNAGPLSDMDCDRRLFCCRPLIRTAVGRHVGCGVMSYAWLLTSEPMR
jgi:hypothetical protein